MVDGMWLFAEGAEVYSTVLWSCSKETDWKELILEHGWPYYVDIWTVLHLIVICMQSHTKPFPFSMSLCFMCDTYLWKIKFLCIWGSLFTGNIKGEMESSVMIYMENLVKMHVF